MKVYSVKSSAVRAAKAAGLAQYEIVEQDGQFSFRPVKTKNSETVEVPAKLVAVSKSKSKKPAANSKRAPAKKAALTVASVSTIESPVRRVWEIADSMPDAKRKDVVAACVEQGIAFYTARTQYQKWRQNQAT